MPTRFSGARAAFTPATNKDNWTFTCNSAMLKITTISWGGRTLQSSPYRTRWVRPASAPVGSATTLSLQGYNPAVSTSGLLQHTWSTTEPTLPAEPINLFAVDWNAQGGEGFLNLPRNSFWNTDGAAGGFAYLSCRNVQGVDASSSHYGLIVEE